MKNNFYVLILSSVWNILSIVTVSREWASTEKKSLSFGVKWKMAHIWTKNIGLETNTWFPPSAQCLTPTKWSLGIGTLHQKEFLAKSQCTEQKSEQSACWRRGQAAQRVWVLVMLLPLGSIAQEGPFPSLGHGSMHCEFTHTAVLTRMSSLLSF